MRKLPWPGWCALIASSALLCACGGGSGDTSGAPPQSSTGAAGAPTPAAGTDSGAAAQPPVNKLAAAITAAKTAASSDPLCDTATLGDFYWEIGDAASDAPLVANTQGGGSVTATSRFDIASASKFVFGAYVLEKKGIDAVRNNPSLHDGLRFLSGYTGFNDDACIGKLTIGACYAAGNQANATLPDPNTQGRFYYDSGHDQKLAAVDLGLSSYTAKQLDQDYQATLGLSSGFSMAPLDPLMAGGLFASASDYAQFLRRIMRQQLVIGAHLGEDATCAQPAVCPDKALYSPVVLLNEPWSYSYNHWVESEHGNGTVDAYSSPGKFGFYPWISPDRQYYGILSRHDTQQPGAGSISARCGRQIRKAFLAAMQAPA